MDRPALTGPDEQASPEAADGAKPRDGTVQSVSVAAHFLRVLSSAERALALGEIAKRTGTGRSTAHRYMQSLVKEGLAQQDPLSSHYDLGPLSLSIGVAALRRVDAVETAGRHIKELSLTHGISAGIAIWTERGPTVVRWHNSAYFAISAVGLGTILPLNNTACGLVCQAYLPARSIAEANENQPESFRGSPPSAALLQQVHDEKWCELTSHLLPDIAGQAAPVFDAQGDLACIVTAVADLGKLQSPEQLTALKAAAAAINRETSGSSA